MAQYHIEQNPPFHEETKGPFLSIRAKPILTLRCIVYTQTQKESKEKREIQTPFLCSVTFYRRRLMFVMQDEKEK